MNKFVLISILHELELFALSEADESAVVCEALFKPQIVPPSHRGQIAKPHVRELVNCHLIPHLVLQESLFFIGSQESVSQNYETHIFHATYSELWHKYLVVLLEREGTRVKVLKEVYCYLYRFKSLIGIYILNLRFTTVDLHGNSEIRLILKGTIGTCT
jgi:hypothetical protein